MALYPNQTEWWACVKDRTKGFFEQSGKWQAFFHRRQHKRLTRAIIHKDQSCVVPGCQIHGALPQLRHVLQLEWDSGQKMTVLNLDLEKAYDRVSHRFLFKTLQWMGIPPTFTSWIRMLYADKRSKVLVNGFLSERIVIESGVHQCCPLSSIFFICAIDPLAQRIGLDPGILGVQIPGGSKEQAKVLAYMDD
ncbi:hypothetical protein Y1Q_0005507 [Alligator mississippiensis]|nr:hypothetical protein Y1Q_0005507 [Alligator mississippiensis]